jgi:Tol biopolymer transport system component
LAISAHFQGRRVFRAVLGYGVVAFALLQIIEPIMHGLHLPEATLTWALLALAVAFPIVITVAWLTGSFEGEIAPAGWRHAWPLAAALAALLLGAALFLYWRRAAMPPPPKLVQATFEGGIEEYPAWSPDGKNLLYVAQSGLSRKIFRKNLRTGQVAQLTHGDADELQPAWSPDGSKILFVRAHDVSLKLQPGDMFGMFLNGDLWQFDLRSEKETPVLSDAYNPAWAPDGTQIAVDASWAGPRRIWVLDGEGHNPQQVTTDSSEEVAHVAPRFSPDGRKVVFQNIERTKFDIRVVNLDSKQLSWITNDVASDTRPVWSPSGKFIYFTSDRGGGWNIWRAPVGPDGALAGTLQQITSGAGQDVEPAISADGKQLAFSTLRQNADIWKLPVSPQTGLPTGAPDAVISTTREESRGAWSPDGASIAFNSDRGGEMNIWIHSLKDGSTRQATTGPGGDFQPNWSPDSARIAFFSSRHKRPAIFTVEVESGKLTALTPGDSIDAGPFFSPDGTHIAFQSDRTGRTEVWVMRADGGDPRQLTRVGASGHFVRWTNQGDAVVFRCPCGGKNMIMAAPVAGGDATPFAEINGGAHMSFSPDRARIMDVVQHRVLWVSPVKGGRPEKVFEFPDPNSRIDYPVWSPDGRYVLFDRQRPEGGDIWVLRDFE